MRKLIACTLAVFAWIFAFGQNRVDSVKVYFHVSQYRFDPDLDGNAASMNSFIESVRAAAISRDLDRVVIRAYASPEGSDNFNNRLSEQRCATIASLIINGAGIAPDMIESIPEGVSWAEFRRLVEAAPSVPSRQAILDIVDTTPLWIFDAKGNIVGSRKKRLMDLRGGRPWQWLVKHLFPEMRNSVAVSFCLKPAAPSPAAPSVAEPELSARADTVAPDSGQLPRFIGVVDVPDVEESDLNSASAAGVDAAASSALAPAASPLSLAPDYRLAVKTNLLYYGILLPNVELEWLINDNWSVAVDADFAWWGRYKNKKSYRLALFDAEVRRWIKPREPWRGMYVGLLAGGGYYDLANGDPGRYGDGLMAGLSAGYMWPIGRRLSLEAEIGLGYMHTRYKEYNSRDNHHVYQRTKDLNYFGPIKLKFSIAWRFFDINKPKRADSAL